MPGQGPVSDWTEGSPSAEPLAEATGEGEGEGEGGGGGGSLGHAYYQNSKGTDRIKDGHKMNSHIAKLQELWKTPQIQTIHIPKSVTDMSFLKHPDLTTGQKRYLCSFAKIYNANYLRMLMKRQYMHVIQRSSQKPGVLTQHRSRLSSRYSQKQHYPCTTWRHQLEREDSEPSNMAAVSAPEMIRQHSLWSPVRNKESLKTGYASKTRCKSLKIFRKPGRMFMPSGRSEKESRARNVAFSSQQGDSKKSKRKTKCSESLKIHKSISTNDSEPYMNEEKKEEDLLNKYMQSMSIEENGEHLMLT